MLKKEELDEILMLKNDVKTWWSMGNAIDAGKTLKKIQEIRNNAKRRDGK